MCQFSRIHFFFYSSAPVSATPTPCMLKDLYRLPSSVTSPLWFSLLCRYRAVTSWLPIVFIKPVKTLMWIPLRPSVSQQGTESIFIIANIFCEELAPPRSLSGFSPGTPASLHNTKICRLGLNLLAILGVYVPVNGCLSLCVGPVIFWPVLGVPCLSSSHSYPQRIRGIDNG